MKRSGLVIGLCLWASAVCAEPLESGRLGELQAEYASGSKLGYGAFVAEMRQKLESAEDLKEAARLATLIRAYIHGQIISFDHGKALTEEDRYKVLQAHASVTAFLTLSPLGTDRYREDTLRRVMKDVNGRYAQELTIVADAVQAALWAGQAGTREHARKEVFLRWMNPYYQKGGAVDVSEALGNWGYDNYDEARKLVDDVIRRYVVAIPQLAITQKQYDNDDEARKLVDDVIGRYVVAIPQLAITQKQIAVLKAIPADTIIDVCGDGQCGFFSCSNPYFRNNEPVQPANPGSAFDRALRGDNCRVSHKFIDAFDRALYDPELFWMLVVYVDANDASHPRWGDEKYKSLKFDRSLYDRDPRYQEARREMRMSQYHAQLKGINMLLERVRQYPNAPDAAELIKKTQDSLSSVEEKYRLKQDLSLLFPDLNQLEISLMVFLTQKQSDWRDQYNKDLKETDEDKKYRKDMQYMEEQEYRTFMTYIITNMEHFNTIPVDVKREVIEMAKAYAAYVCYSTAVNTSEKTNLPKSIVSLEDLGKLFVNEAKYPHDNGTDVPGGMRTGNQLEIRPGADIRSPDIHGLILETLVSYLNNQSIYVLCGDAAQLPAMKLSPEGKIGNYYIGKVVNRVDPQNNVSGSQFGRIYTVNNGGASGGHFQVYVTNGTPPIQIANVLRKHKGRRDEWDLIKSAKENKDAPSGERLTSWLSLYVSA